MKTFLDLVHTSKGLRDFIRAEAANICNEKVRAYFQKDLEFLKVTTVDGWLLPRHPEYILIEKQFYDMPCQKASCPRLGLKPTSLKDKWWAESLRGSEPGPMFLFQLENVISVPGFDSPEPKAAYPDLCIKRTKMSSWWHTYQSQEAESTAIKNGEIAWEDGTFWRLPRQYSMMKRRALMWYYGMPGAPRGIECRTFMELQR
jgi:hypothetical protein